MWFHQCEFNNNSAGLSGGGLSARGGPKVIGCLFNGNSSQYGGAIRTSLDATNTQVIASRFESNHALVKGGVANVSVSSRLTMINCIMTGNTGPADAGTVCNSDAGGGFFRLRNCAIVNNPCGGVRTDDDDLSSSVHNTIVRGNGNEFISFAPVVKYSNVQGGMAGDGNIDANPMFVNAAIGNFELTAGSPCIDAGANWGLPADSIDLDGDGLTAELFPHDYNGMPRIADDLGSPDTGCGSVAIVDIGPYEMIGVFAEDILPGDVNGDGLVDVNDLLDLLAAWGPCLTECCPADFDLNGGVDVDDLLTLLANWG